VPLKEHHITCKWCGQEATLWRYPGRPPTLCCDECKRAYERERDRENNRKRQRRYRERQERKREARRLKAELKRLQEAQQATELQSETD